MKAAVPSPPNIVMYLLIYFFLVLPLQKFLFRTETVLADWNEKSCSIFEYSRLVFTELFSNQGCYSCGAEQSKKTQFCSLILFDVGEQGEKASHVVIVRFFTVTFPHLRCNVIQLGCEAIAGSAETTKQPKLPRTHAILYCEANELS